MRKTVTLWLTLLSICLVAAAWLVPAGAFAASADTGNAGPAGLLAFGTIDLFGTRFLLDTVNQFKRPKRFLLDMFFKGFRQFDTKTVDIDIYKGKRRMAPFVSPVLEGKVMERLGYSTNSYAPPYIKPKRPTVAGDLLARPAGTVVYPGSQTAGDRAAALLTKDLMELMDGITRREEWMAASALTTGKINVVGDGVNDLIDFQMAATHLVDLSGNALWSATETSDPIADLQSWCLLTLKDAGCSCNTIVMDPDAWKLFINHPKVKGNTDLLSRFKIQTGQIDPQQMDDGIAFCGTINDGIVFADIYVYAEWYIDDQDNDTEKPILPSGTVICGNPKAQNTKLYGAIQDMKALQELGGTLIAAPFYPKTWITDDPSVQWLMLQSASLPALNQPDAFVSALVK